MSDTLARISSDLKDAMRAKDAARLSVLRMVLNDVKNAGIEKKGRKGFTQEVDSPAEYLSVEEITQVLRGALKRRRESAEQYRAGNREDLAGKEEAEAEVIQEYLPKPLGPEELEKLVQDAIAKTGATSIAQMGEVIKAVMAKAGGRVDGGSVSGVVKRLLS
ncbi:MAG TPA: GatB/YqeY domain-containing protein [Planctomycetota bacterium]